MPHISNPALPHPQVPNQNAITSLLTRVLCKSSLQRRLEETVKEKSVNANKEKSVNAHSEGRNNPEVCSFFSFAMLSIGRCDGD